MQMAVSMKASPVRKAFIIPKADMSGGGLGMVWQLVVTKNSLLTAWHWREGGINVGPPVLQVHYYNYTTTTNYITTVCDRDWKSTKEEGIPATKIDLQWDMLLQKSGTEDGGSSICI